MNTHLFSAHEMTAAQYRARFPGEATACQEARDADARNALHGSEVLAQRGGRRHTVRYQVA
jgi:hypothetical protein